MNKSTLVIGASENVNRYSNMATHKLVKAGHTVFALGLKAGSVAGVPIATTQEPLKNIDTITLYIGPQHQAPYLDYIIDLAPKRVIFNPGTENDTLEQELQAHGIHTQKACTLVLLGTGQY